ncbi:hypothetical protein CDCA_CDCA17G4436 [Cyanidium caldarium]|uniref:GNAT family N-acetyltransferase n=1 Tax=Cyanidium caldarium TaxID=2771 RepID=A0AAV9J1X0_CYACA|nr:hypothetical protein CDCA_CDCA17G4436 [Cyanidium caldarium]
MLSFAAAPALRLSYTLDDVHRAARRDRLTLVDRCIGPWLQFDAILEPHVSSAPESTPVVSATGIARRRRVGTIYGWSLRPLWARVHVEQLRVRAAPGLRLPPATARYLCLALGCRARERGCQQAYVLAIDDAPRQHRRLVRYFSQLGLAPLRPVDQGVVDRLVWGGCGLLMGGAVEDILRRGEKWVR